MSTPVLALSLALGLVAAPLGAIAQAPPGKVYRVGWLHPLPIPPDWEEGFRQGLREFGYAEGRISSSSADGAEVSTGSRRWRRSSSS
jgi:hypothetical protein